MIYLVTTNIELFESQEYKIIGVDESLSLLNSCQVLQYDSETDGRNCHINKLLCVQFGNKKRDFQIVVDCSCININLYKEVLETKYIIGHNLKFDLQFLYNYNIIPRKVYDTMIVEQLLYLGYPSGVIRYSLKEVAWRRLNIDIDKTVRGEIIWRGLDAATILYSAGDVMYLEDIMYSQIKDCKIKQCLIGAKLECDCVPAMAYLEWCGIKLDANKWKSKMIKDQQELLDAKNALDSFCISNSSLSKFTEVDLQGDLFKGFNTDPVCTINWSSSRQVVEVAKILGFNTTIQDKKTGEDKDSVIEKHLSNQKGINDEFLKLYFNYQEKSKLCSSFGQGHINAINPITGRIHTNYWQLGTISSRMSSGGGINTELAKYKGIPAKDCPNPNMQQLPHDAVTRSCFISEPNNLFCSCDYAAVEARIGAMVYNEKSLIDEFLYGSGDSHAAYAKAVFAKELEGIDVKDVKKKRPDLRNKVKSIEFAVQFGSDGTAAAPQLGIPVEEARELVKNLLSNMKGLNNFKIKGSQSVRKLGYVIGNKITGHKSYWWDHDKWLDRQESFTPDFWNEYREKHKGTGDSIAQEVREHFQAASKWDRMALNIPTQMGGAVVLKTAIVDLWNWVLNNNLFNKVLFVNFTHDEINCEFPKELTDFPNILQDIMKKAGDKYYSLIPLYAEAEVSDHWVH